MVVDAFANDERDRAPEDSGIERGERRRLDVAPVRVERRDHGVTDAAIDLIGLRKRWQGSGYSRTLSEGENDERERR